MRKGRLRKGKYIMSENKADQWNGADLRDVLYRIDEIHRAVTRAVGRINYLKESALRANSSLTPVRYGRGVERSRVEYAVLESDAERWGIGELQKELETLLDIVRPLVERLPAGLIRAIAVQRIVEGTPCGLIGRKMHFSRCYIYRLLNQANDRLCELYAAELNKKRFSQAGNTILTSVKG